MSKTPMEILLKTYSFMVLRFLLGSFTLVPLYVGITYSVEWGRKITGANSTITDIMFGYCGVALFALYITSVHKILMHYVSYAHVASATAYLKQKKGNKKSYGILYGGAKVLDKFGAVSGLFIADLAIRSATRKVSEIILEKGTFIPDVIKKGVVGGAIKGVLTTIVFRSTSVIASYMFSSKKDLWDSVAEGTSLYVKSWKSVFQGAFMSLVWSKIIGMVFNVIVFCLFCWQMWGSSLRDILLMYIAYRIVIALIKNAVVEPYHTIYMVTVFNNNLPALEDTEDLSEELSEVYSKIERSSILSKDRTKIQEELRNSISDIMTKHLEVSDDNYFAKATKILGSMKKSEVTNSAMEEN